METPILYMRQGRTIACGHCHPDKFVVPEGMKCTCTCHDEDEHLTFEKRQEEAEQADRSELDEYYNE